MSVRNALWARILAQPFEREGLTGMADWILAHRDALIASPDDPDDPRTGWVGGSEAPEPPGPRCFLKRWEPGESTERHTHPSGMLMVVLDGALVVGEGWDAASERRSVLEPGQWQLRLAPEGGYAHHPHVIHSPGPSISLHLYSDAPNRGRAVPG